MTRSLRSPPTPLPFLPAPRSRARRDPAEEPVVLLDPRGQPSGSLAKGRVHHDRTPLHLGFSCHVVAPDGRVLLTRRAAGKRTWPATWSNACCGHPQPGETLRRAVERRLRDELGLVPRRMALAVPDFAYRAVMDDGTVEHELCPVVVAEVDGTPFPDPDEVDGVDWVGWDALRARAASDPASLSPWAVEQVDRLAALAPTPLALLDAGVPAATAAGVSTALPHFRWYPAPRRSAGPTTPCPSCAGRSSALSPPSSPTGWRTWRTSILPPSSWRPRCSASFAPAESGCGPPSRTGGIGPPAPRTTTA